MTNEILDNFIQEEIFKELIEAIKCLDIRTVKKLIARGVDVEAKDENGCSPEGHALRLNDRKMLRLLNNTKYANRAKKRTEDLTWR